MYRLEYYTPELCEIAALDRLEIEQELRKIGFEYIDFFNFKEVQAYLCKKGNREVLVFRASEKKWKDWLRNFDFNLIKTSIGKCHQGYYKVLSEMFRCFLSKIKDKNIYICGHSQGAGLSIILSKMLNRWVGYNTTYGAIDPPRITNDSRFNINGFTTINKSSIVPKLPLRSMGYHHTGTVLYFGTGGKMYVNSKWIFRVFNVIIDRFTEHDVPLNLDDFVDDHKLEEIKPLFKDNYSEIEKYIK